MNIDKAHLQNCIDNAPHCDLRSNAALCLIDGVILSALPYDGDIAYLAMHQNDSGIMSELAKAKARNEPAVYRWIRDGVAEFRAFNAERIYNS